MPRRRRLTPKDIATVRELYPIMPTDELARRIGRSVGALYVLANRLDLRKAPAYSRKPAPRRAVAPKPKPAQAKAVAPPPAVAPAPAPAPAPPRPAQPPPAPRHRDKDPEHLAAYRKQLHRTARDSVEYEMNTLLPHAGYPRYAENIAALRGRLQLIDAALAAKEGE